MSAASPSPLLLVPPPIAANSFAAPFSYLPSFWCFPLPPQAPFVIPPSHTHPSFTGGAILTNPADVLRNEMFKQDNRNLLQTLDHLNETEGFKKWAVRGIDKNLVSVAIPVSVTIFFIDIFSSLLQPSI